MSGTFARHIFLFHTHKILNTVKGIIVILFFVGITAIGSAQGISQQVKGNVKDILTLKPLANASVILQRDSLELGTTTNDKGFFILQNIPLGRYRIRISFTGYSTYEDELLVISGRESHLNVSLSEATVVLNEVRVGSSSKAQDYVPGLQIIGMEKTMRIPANFFDPVRMATTYPGVVAANDQGNAIIVKGNSPNGLLWRLNGLDIVNPNHLANAGTLSDKPISNGGGVNILSAQMLAQTQFYTGAFPASYGNAMSGILDMNLREGNKSKVEGTAQASLLGIDLSLESPMGKNQNASALVNYRYSTIGLLSKLGVQLGDEEISFQDISMNLKYDQKNGGKLSVFGFYGDSKNKFEARDFAKWKEDKDRYTITYQSATYAFGMNYVVPIGRGSLFTGVAYSSSNQKRDAIVSSQIPVGEEFLLNDDYKLNRALLSSNINYSVKVGERSLWEIGMMTNFYDDAVHSIKEWGTTVGPTNMSTQEGSGSGVLFQPFTTWKTLLSEKWKMNLGVRYLNYTYNKTNSIEPRASLTFAANAKSVFDLSYGLVSQLQQPTTYFAVGNKNLEFTKSHHVALGLRQQISPTLKLSGELYYQHLINVPIQMLQSSYSVVNALEGFAKANLVNDGTADNIGLNATFEKQFYSNHYFMLTGGYYESTYSGSDKVKRDTRFNGKYTMSGVYGKEWSNSKKGRVIGLSLRALYLGGLRTLAIDEAASEVSTETVYDEQDAYSEKLNDYFRVDARLSFRKNKAKYTRTFAIDIQNITAQQNEAYRYYDHVQQKIVTKNQLGIIPVIVYRIDF